MSERSAKRRSFRAVSWACLLAACSAANAQTEGDRCNDILRANLMNESSSSSSNTSKASTTYQEILFELDSSSAFEEYKRARDNHKKQATSASGDFGYAFGFIEASGSFSHNFDREISESEFKTKFEAEKRQRQRNRQGAGEQQASSIAIIRSRTRDSASVTAWERCMTQRREPDLYTYGFRDASGNPFLVVMWTPGAFASTFPSISVQFPQQGADMTIVGARDNMPIAVGSGVSFPIKLASPSDKRATRDSFTVLVNGQLVKPGGERVNSFRSTAVIPAFSGPIACSEYFEIGRTYVVDSVVDTQAVSSPMTIVADPDGLPNQLRGIIIMGGSQRVLLDIVFSGTNASLMKAGKDSTGARRRAPFIQATCSGSGAIATFSEFASTPGAKMSVAIRRGD